jgi:hypothetical protein
VEDRIFGEFSRKVGVANIHEYRETKLRRINEAAERRSVFGSP